MAIVDSKITNAGEDAGARTKMRDDIWKANEELLNAHPEVRVMINLVWTPRPDDWPRSVPYDDTHTSIQAGADDVTPEQLEHFLHMAILQLVSVFDRVRMRDKDLLDKMLK